MRENRPGTLTPNKSIPVPLFWKGKKKNACERKKTGTDEVKTTFRCKSVEIKQEWKVQGR